MLDKIVKSAEMTKKENKSIKNDEMVSYLKDIRESNWNYNARIENIRLKNLVEILKKENSKIPKAKDLLSDYKDALKQKEDEIARLKKNNQDLYEYIQKIPKFLRKIFIKNEDIKLLNTNNNKKGEI